MEQKPNNPLLHLVARPAVSGVPVSCLPPDLAVICVYCGAKMVPEHAHYRCPRCHNRDSCCW